jgi:Ca-activated chloride channel homolog
MIFENPNALWLLLVVPFLLFGIGLWGWNGKKQLSTAFALNYRHLKRKQIEKYTLVSVPVIMLIMAVALPKVAFSSYEITEKSGEVALLADVSGSMAAQNNSGTPDRLERVKTLLYEIVDSMEESGQVKVSLFGITNVARSHVPFVNKEDYPYLRESIKKVLNINSTPGVGTSFGQPILNVADKFSEGDQTKLIILFSDGEPFFAGASGMTDYERGLIDQAVKKVTEQGIKVITVGVGEQEGAKIPIINPDGVFTGEYNQLRDGTEYISYLDENNLEDIAHRTSGEYFFESNPEELLQFIRDNLGSANVGDIKRQAKSYRSIASWFIFSSLPFWIIFARRYML